MFVAEIHGPPEYGLPIVPIMVLTYHAKITTKCLTYALLSDFPGFCAAVLGLQEL